MSAGSSSLSRRRRVSGGSVVLTSRWATCASAWTPGIGAAGSVELEVARGR